MWDTRHIVVTAVIPFVLLCAGVAGLVWPTYAQMHETRDEIRTLERKVESLPQVTESVEGLAEQLDELQVAMDSDLKIIPEHAEIASLIRRLSLPVDGRTVRDQTFTTGSPNSAIAGAKDPEVLAMPLTVDMEANFDSLIAMIRAAESMERLVRVSTVRIQREGDNGGKTDHRGHPVLTASVSLEAIYRARSVEGAP